jgi:hypothetical protein
MRDRQAFRAAEEAKKKTGHCMISFITAMVGSQHGLSAAPKVLEQVGHAVDQISQQSLSNAQPISHKKKCK